MTTTIENDRFGAIGWCGLARREASAFHPHMPLFLVTSVLVGGGSGPCDNGGGDDKSGASDVGEDGGEGVGAAAWLSAAANGGGVRPRGPAGVRWTTAVWLECCATVSLLLIQSGAGLNWSCGDGF